MQGIITKNILNDNVFDCLGVCSDNIVKYKKTSKIE
jgi:hypothetical protein